jgi:hypothetical protein
MVCATDVLLGWVMTPSEDGVLSGIRLPFEGRRSCARLQEQIVSDSRKKGDELLGIGRETGDAAVGVVQDHQVPAPRGLALAKRPSRAHELSVARVMRPASTEQATQ